MDGFEDNMFEWPEEITKDLDFSQIELVNNYLNYIS